MKPSLGADQDLLILLELKTAFMSLPPLAFECAFLSWSLKKNIVSLFFLFF